MNIITLCRGGNVRSVAAKMILSRYLHYEVIAIGAENTNSKTKDFLFNWADKIVVMSINKEILSTISEKFQDKVILFNVGNDIWGNPFHKELQKIIIDKLNSGKYNFITNGKTISLKKVLERIDSYKLKIKTRNRFDGAL